MVLTCFLLVLSTWQDLPDLAFTEADTLRYFRDPKGRILMETRDRAILAVPVDPMSEEYGYRIEWDSKFDLASRFMTGGTARNYFFDLNALHILEMKEEIVGAGVIDDLVQDSTGFMTGRPPSQMLTNPAHAFELGSVLGEIRYSRSAQTLTEGMRPLNVLPLIMSMGVAEVSTPVLGHFLNVNTGSTSSFTYTGVDHAALLVSSALAFGLWPKLLRGEKSGPFFLSLLPDGAIRDPRAMRSMRMVTRLAEIGLTFTAATGVHFCMHAISQLIPH